MTWTVPEPVKVPEPEITTPDPGFKMVLAPFMFKVPEEAILMLVLTAMAAEVLETVRL